MATRNRKRYLIINADDFGQSRGVNRGIVEAHELGTVTSASLMVRWPAAEEAADYAHAHPELSVGLHLDIAEWAYRNDEWTPLYKIVERDDAKGLGDEICAQLARFRELLGCNPTHIDSHQHFHQDEPARSIVQSLARELRIPMRDFTSQIKYIGEFYGQTEEGEPYPEGISVENLARIFQGIPSPCAEIGCHPGYADDLNSMYQAERELEVHALCDARLFETARESGIELCSFLDFPRIVSINEGKPAPLCG
jgi:predicted glycoside hydrolase/deacetylase ChbG (UPF0249 family)